MLSPQNRAVLTMLRQHPSGITPIDALREAHTMRLAARVYELRQLGYVIEARRHSSLPRVWVYVLHEKAAA